MTGSGNSVEGRAFDRVLIIMFENHYYSYVAANPYMQKLARQGIELVSSFGVMHPSQTNYIASIAGELCGVTNDDRFPLIDERTIVDLIEEAPGGLRWKGYMDSYIPQASPWKPDFVPQDGFPYVIKHNPFSSFASVARNEARWRQIENEASFFSDVLNGELPEYAWFSPNVWNDGHWLNGTQEESNPRAPGLVDQLAIWLEDFFGRLRFPGPSSHLPPRTLVVVTFDEADFEVDYEPDMAYAYDGPNQIYTVLLGDCVRPGIEEEGYNHYSLLRTIEKNFGLGDLGKNDAESNWFQFLWGRRFGWSAAKPTPVGGTGAGLCAEGFGDSLFVGAAGPEGTMLVRRWTGGNWSDEETLPIDGSGGAALVAGLEDLVLVARSASGEIGSLSYDTRKGWSKTPAPLAPAGTVGFAVTAFNRDTKLMLAVADSEGKVSSRVRAGDTWGEPVPVPAAGTVGGGIELGTLGTSVFLIVQAPGAALMNVVSYNSAPFNSIIPAPFKYGGPHCSTTTDAWSPSAHPVAHFSSRPDAVGERQPEALPYETGGTMVAATLDGVLHLVHPAPGEPQLATQTFSISGVLTPTHPVSYKRADLKTANNGFGTLAEAGWSRQKPIPGTRWHAGELALARAGNELALLSRARPGDPVELRIGRYEQHDGSPQP